MWTLSCTTTTATTTLNASLQDGIFLLTVEELKVSGKPLPSAMMGRLKKQNLARDLYSTPERVRLLRRFKSMTVEGGRLIIRTQALKKVGL